MLSWAVVTGKTGTTNQKKSQFSFWSLWLDMFLYAPPCQEWDCKPAFGRRFSMIRAFIEGCKWYNTFTHGSLCTRPPCILFEIVVVTVIRKMEKEVQTWLSLAVWWNWMYSDLDHLTLFSQYCIFSSPKVVGHKGDLGYATVCLDIYSALLCHSYS